MQKQERERKTYSFREGMPPEVYKIIIREQNRIKERDGKSQYSIERTIYQIIKEFDKLKRLHQCP